MQANLCSRANCTTPPLHALPRCTQFPAVSDKQWQPDIMFRNACAMQVDIGSASFHACIMTALAHHGNMFKLKYLEHGSTFTYRTSVGSGCSWEACRTTSAFCNMQSTFCNRLPFETGPIVLY